MALLAAAAGGLPAVVSGVSLEAGGAPLATPPLDHAATTSGDTAGGWDDYPLLLVPPPAVPTSSGRSTERAGDAAISSEAADLEAALLLELTAEGADADHADNIDEPRGTEHRAAERPGAAGDDAATAAAPASPAEAASPGPASSMVALVNAARADAGLPPLAVDGTLSGIASQRSADMVRRDYFAHVGPDGQGVQQLLAAASVGYRTAGENLARVGGTGDDDVRGAVEVQLRSATHRANLLSPAYTHIGVGYAVEADGVAVFTLVFVGR